MLVLLFLGLLVLALAAPIPQNSTPAGYSNTIAPRMKTATYVANITDPALTRDSCGSSRIGDRVFWTCRDTQAYDVAAGKAQALPIMTNTAAWTDLKSEGGPKLGAGPAGAASDGIKPILQMYGGDAMTMPTYFPVQANQCPGSGACGDGTRYPVWPDQPPLVAQNGQDGSAVTYTWTPNVQLRGVNNGITENPSHNLYKGTYSPSADPNAVPKVELVAAAFYGENEVAYGRYGSVISKDIAYLYGQTADQQTVLARVAPGKIEDRSAYEYYQTSTQRWVTTAPVFNASTATSAPSYGALESTSVPAVSPSKDTQSTYIIPNAGFGGQGTFYYSSYFSRFVWIGQSSGMDGMLANFYITTAPSPEGPWTEPTSLFQGESGDHPMAQAYTLQAHPSLLPSGPDVASEAGIYLSWTQQWQETTVGSVYVTPLVWLEFE
ncbi:hypothetical protein Slin15195_G104250 [Septoria linicola]|uniref:DUF4185 domain-containing protein n=1 Tax=Septoria linicola TaxID=215465 RepID=A0A9Q9EMT5_9PEZI|nr:hypothetical protein Slin14017_G067290 [Septoria linicola]USW57106.1 hypothetical protein Slin15195_G104250 [Septoria linicola]